MQHDLKSILGVNQSIDPVAVATGNSPQTGAACDTRSFDSGMFVISVGAIVAAGLATIALQEGDLADSSDMANIAAADLEGAIAAFVTSAPQRIGYKGSKRYVRAVATYVSGTSIVLGVNFIKGRPRALPVP